MTKSDRATVSFSPGQGWDYGFIEHPFVEEEKKKGVRYCVYNRRLMAVSFETKTNEEGYWNLRKTAGTLHTGENTIEINGPDSTKLLDLIFTRNIHKTKINKCSYQIACYQDGGIITDGVLLKLSDDRYWYAQADGDLFSWIKAHSLNFDANVFVPKNFISQVQGPNSLKILKELIDVNIDEFKYYNHAEFNICGENIIISRTGYTNELGWEIYFEEHHDYHKIWNKINEIGEKYGIGSSGLDSFEPRRIEAGILNAGSDFNETNNPFQIGLGTLVDLSKDNFIGKEALLNSSKETYLLGLQCDNGTPKWKGNVYKNSIHIGNITCGAYSPFLLKGVGYVYFKDSIEEINSTVQIECIDGSLQDAVVVKLPMYDEEKKIPRGLE